MQSFRYGWTKTKLKCEQHSLWSIQFETKVPSAFRNNTSQIEQFILSISVLHKQDRLDSTIPGIKFAKYVHFTVFNLNVAEH